MKCSREKEGGREGGRKEETERHIYIYIERE
jgi:hypothetical protein